MITRLVSLTTLSLLVAGCGWAHYYGNWEEPDTRIPGYETVFRISRFEIGHPTDSNYTNWDVSVYLRPPRGELTDTLSLKTWLELCAHDSSRVDSVEIYLADSAGRTHKRIEVMEYGTDRGFSGKFSLASPWPPAIAMRAYFSIWREPGVWSTREEDYLLPYRRRLEGYVGE